jgi:hypothetical protein
VYDIDPIEGFAIIDGNDFVKIVNGKCGKILLHCSYSTFLLGSYSLGKTIEFFAIVTS